MKNFLFILVITFLTGNNSFGQGIQFDNSPWKELLAKAKKEDKLVFVDAYAAWCGPCKKMDRDVFTKKEVGDYFNTKFINAKIDMEKGEGVGLSNQFGIMAYPTLLFVNSEGEVVHRSVGYHTPDLLLDLGKAALDPTRNMGSISSRYKKGDRSPDLLYQLALTKLDAMDGSYVEVAREYLKTQKDWSTKKNREFIYRTANDLKTDMAQYLVAHKSDFEQQLGQRAISAKINDLVQNQVAKAKTEADLKSIEQMYEKMYPGKSAEMSGRLKMGFYAQREDWAGFAKTTNEHYKKFPPKSWEDLNENAWIFYEEVQDKKLLKTALKWAKKSVKMDRNYYNTDTTAALYYRLGKKRKALKTARQAIELAKQTGEDHSSTDALLNEIRKM